MIRKIDGFRFLFVFTDKGSVQEQAQLVPVKNEAGLVDCLPPPNVFWSTNYLFLF